MAWPHNAKSVRPYLHLSTRLCVSARAWRAHTWPGVELSCGVAATQSPYDLTFKYSEVDESARRAAPRISRHFFD